MSCVAFGGCSRIRIKRHEAIDKNIQSCALLSQPFYDQRAFRKMCKLKRMLLRKHDQNNSKQSLIHRCRLNPNVKSD